VHLDTDGSLSLVFVSNEGIDVQVDEAVLGGELIGNFLTEVVAVGTWSDVDGSGFNLGIDLSLGFFRGLLGADGEEVGLCLQIW
jgi:hypothetical protein